MSIFAMTKKCYPQNEISTHIIIRIKINIKIATKKNFILIRIIIRIIMNIKISIRIIINILMRIKISIKIQLDTMMRMCYYNIIRNIKIRIEIMRNGGKQWQDQDSIAVSKKQNCHSLSRQMHRKCWILSDEKTMFQSANLLRMP